MSKMSAAVVYVNKQVQQQSGEQHKASASARSNGSTYHVTHSTREKSNVTEEHELPSSETINCGSDEEKRTRSCAHENYAYQDCNPKVAVGRGADPLPHSLSEKSSGLDSNTRGAAIEEEEDVDVSSSCVLPGRLRSIMSEVARTGEILSLAWNSVRKRPPTELLNGKLERRSFAVGGSSSLTSAFAAAAPVAVRPRTVASYLGVASSNNLKNAVGPPRKKQRNGSHGTSHRKSRQNQQLKRPLYLIRSSAAGGTTTTTTVSVPSPNVAAAVPAAASATARFTTSTSGSEPDDTSHYDSEGTSTTSNSEFSLDQQKHRNIRLRSQHLFVRTTNVSPSCKRANLVRYEGPSAPMYASCLREAFRISIGLVLDSWFQNKGGYTLSPAEKKIHRDRALTTKDIFMLRRDRLLKRLEAPEADEAHSNDGDLGGPPFTMQRIAEVLVNPEKYYTQTHKLCNCLEKLLLVSSPTSAFGGSLGGVTSQSQREEQELAALTDERVRMQAEFRQLKRRRSSLASNASHSEAPLQTSCLTGSENGGDTEHAPAADSRFLGSTDDGVAHKETPFDWAEASAQEQREELEAAARASLRSKFDHVGIDPHHQNHSMILNANTLAIVESRSLTNSPPPPNLASVPNLSGGLLRSPHATSPGEHPVRSLSPILFSDVSSPTTAARALANPNMHILQMHHAAAVAGVSPFEVMALGACGGSVAAHTAAALLGSAQFNAMKEQDLESRSSASSDVDSESDDISFDDSASDRSDGSDSGFACSPSAIGEGATAAASNIAAVARAMALKRQHQTTRAVAVSQRAAVTAPKMPPAVDSNGNSAIQDPATSSCTTLLSASDEIAPEDSDVSDSSLSDMAE